MIKIELPLCYLMQAYLMNSYHSYLWELPADSCEELLPQSDRCKRPKSVRKRIQTSKNETLQRTTDSREIFLSIYISKLTFSIKPFHSATLISPISKIYFSYMFQAKMTKVFTEWFFITLPLEKEH